jgi:glycosyltransferase involved in cell wall biosynthesis
MKKKPSKSRAPYISIVIAIRNVADALAVTMQNISLQTFTDFEVIIADCNSTDGAANVVRKFDYPIQHVVQADTGIYDAWNKVLPSARGEWVIFFGAGDIFASEDAMEKACVKLQTFPNSVQLAYGKVRVIGENGSLLHLDGSTWASALLQISKFHMFPHQAAFQRRTSFDHFGYFSKAYSVAGDTEMILRLANMNEPMFFDETIACFQYGGKSSTLANRRLAVDEMTRIMAQYHISYDRKWIDVKLICTDLCIKFLPNRLTHLIVDFYRLISGRRKRY